MRIVSKQKDYYDGVMQHGIDLDLVYVRDNREEVLDEKYSGIVGSCPGIVGFWSQVHVIGFCGTLYPVVQLWKNPTANPHSYQYHENRDPDPKEMYTDLDHIDRFVEANLSEERVEKYYAHSTEKYSFWRHLANRQGWEKFYESYNEKSTKHYQSLFDEAKAPVFVVSSGHRVFAGVKKYDNGWSQNIMKQGVRFNPFLKNYAFAKVKDPYTAFQEIRMWISNQASPERKMIEMSNEDTAARLGHGDKYSFRKAPTKKRKGK